MIYLLVGIMLVVLMTIVVLRNQLVRAKNLVDAARADIDAQLVLRSELIPKLIQVTKHYALHESEVLTKIASDRARTLWYEKDDFPQILNKISVIQENYPDLKADASFERLLQEIKKVEDHLLFARRFYNGTTEAYNTKIQRFPASLISNSFGFRAQPYCVAD